MVDGHEQRRQQHQRRRFVYILHTLYRVSEMSEKNKMIIKIKQNKYVYNRVLDLVELFLLEQYCIFFDI